MLKRIRPKLREWYSPSLECLLHPRQIGSILGSLHLSIQSSQWALCSQPALCSLQLAILDSLWDWAGCQVLWMGLRIFSSSNLLSRFLPKANSLPNVLTCGYDLCPISIRQIDYTCGSFNFQTWPVFWILGPVVQSVDVLCPWALTQIEQPQWSIPWNLQSLFSSNSWSSVRALTEIFKEHYLRLTMLSLVCSIIFKYLVNSLVRSLGFRLINLKPVKGIRTVVIHFSPKQSIHRGCFYFHQSDNVIVLANGHSLPVFSL